MTEASLTVNLLGPVELSRAGRTVPAGGPTQRAVLAMLALRIDQPVSAAALSDGVWGEADEPAGAAKAMQVHVARLRSALRTGKQQPLQSVPGGYRLAGNGLAVDAAAFERAIADGRRLLSASETVAGLEQLDAALGLWRGPALMDLRDFPFAAHAADRYEELRVDAAEQAIAARLALGESQALVPQLQALIAEHPYRERLHGQLMLALYRSGQQAAALDAYTAARSGLVLDLGVEPGPELQALQQRILAQDPELAAAATTLAGSSRPAARARPAPRLPPAPTLFGRQQLLAELEGLAPAERLITLTGAGGSGKTALAIALAHRLAARYRDGAFFVDLAAVSRPDEVLPATAAGMGIAPDFGNLADELATIMAERRMLVVLDNAEHVLGAVPELAPLVEATSGLIVATSRAPLRLHTERLVPVPPLAVPDVDERDLASEPAVQLFLRAATNAGALIERDELPAVANICRGLDGLPLAVELVAAQTAVEAVGELEPQLAARLPRLAAPSRDAPERQRTMHAAIAWSLDRLAPVERRAFEQLAVFAGSFSLRAAGAVLQMDRTQAIRLLGALLDASLATRQPSVGRQAQFRMLEPLRAVGRARSSAAVWADIVRRHAAFMMGEIERLCPRDTGSRSVADVAELRHQHPDVVAALRTMASTAPDECINVLVQLKEYGIWTSQAVESASIADELLAAGALGERAGCDAHLLVARFAFHRGELGAAFEALDRALDLANRSSDALVQARAHLWESIMAAETGDTTRERSAARRAQEEARRSGSLLLQVWTTWIDHTAPDARERVEALLDEAEARKMLLARLVALNGLGSMYNEPGVDPARARKLRKTWLGTLHTVRQVAGADFVALFENNLGSTLIRNGAVKDGRALLLSTLKMTDSLGWPQIGLWPLRGLAEVQAATGEWRDVLVLFSAADALAPELGLRHPAESQEQAAMDAAEEHLGPKTAAEARATGEAMTYREAVNYAYEINSVTPP